MTDRQSGKIRVGLDQITAFCSISRPTFYKFIKMGLPAIMIESRWYAHTENLDDFFKALTRKSMKDVSIEELEKGE